MTTSPRGFMWMVARLLEIDFTNPTWASDHCPPRSTFVHRLSDGRSRRLDVTYVGTDEQR